ncbi:hypothetical protein MASR2M39_25380 [Ignavibacteriales bacterium]
MFQCSESGAGVFLPRERDFQIREIIVDNETSDGNSKVEGFEKWENGGKGFLYKPDGYEANVNPFRLGSFLKTATTTTSESKLSYLADILKRVNMLFMLLMERIQNQKTFLMHYIPCIIQAEQHHFG